MHLVKHLLVFHMVYKILQFSPLAITFAQRKNIKFFSKAAIFLRVVKAVVYDLLNFLG